MKNSIFKNQNHFARDLLIRTLKKETQLFRTELSKLDDILYDICI
jgi:hypothetical protein